MLRNVKANLIITSIISNSILQLEVSKNFIPIFLFSIPFFL